ncbi:MAG: hypothetical protein ACFCBW_10555 [Candidatus Competibacterales bacterium]
MAKRPVALRLSTASVARADALWRQLAGRSGRSNRQVDELIVAFAFKNDERQFARQLLSRRPHYWLFRTHQRHYCGDFVVVDMSSPKLEGRRVFVVDLKQNAPLRRGGGAGRQFANAPEVVAALAQGGLVTPEVGFDKLSGDRRQVLAFLL